MQAWTLRLSSRDEGRVYTVATLLLHVDYEVLGLENLIQLHLQGLARNCGPVTAGTVLTLVSLIILALTVLLRKRPTTTTSHGLVIHYIELLRQPLLPLVDDIIHDT